MSQFQNKIYISFIAGLIIFASTTTLNAQNYRNSQARKGSQKLSGDQAEMQQYQNKPAAQTQREPNSPQNQNDRQRER